MKPEIALFWHRIGLLLVLAQGIASAQTSNPAQAITSGSQVSASAAGGSFAPTFSGDGHSLAFLSYANNLVTNDNRRPWLDLFVHRLESGETILASANLEGTGGSGGNVEHFLSSADGTRIVFVSNADDFTDPPWTNSYPKMLVRDLSDGRTYTANLNTNNQFVRLSRSSFPAAISQDGRYVLFQESADFSRNAIYRRDLQSNLVTEGDVRLRARASKSKP